jgi:hypothetical protein
LVAFITLSAQNFLSRLRLWPASHLCSSPSSLLRQSKFLKFLCYCHWPLPLHQRKSTMLYFFLCLDWGLNSWPHTC